MDAISLIMFSFMFCIAFVFSLLAIMERPREDEKGETQAEWTCILFSTIAVVGWWIFSIVWPAYATESAFVWFAYLWFAFGWIFVAVTFGYVFLFVKAILTKRRAKSETFVIREKQEEY
jgi:hypothetical protein